MASEPHSGPCRHMEGFIEKHRQGRLRGFARWYALAHFARCRRCGDFLRFLEDTILRLRENRDAEVPADVLARLKAGAWRESSPNSDRNPKE